MAVEVPAIRTEIKVLVKPKHQKRLLEALGAAAVEPMDSKAWAPKVRKVVFFDTPGLSLFEQGVVLRKEVSKKDVETTVKLRPVDFHAVPPEQRLQDGFKLEEDRVVNRSLPSASLKAKGQADAFVEYTALDTIASLFDDAQERLPEHLLGVEVPFDDLRATRPSRALKWEAIHPDYPDELVVERWELPTGQVFVELSTKVPADQVLETEAKILDLLESARVKRPKVQESKTMLVLETLR